MGVGSRTVKQSMLISSDVCLVAGKGIGQGEVGGGCVGGGGVRGRMDKWGNAYTSCLTDEALEEGCLLHR